MTDVRLICVACGGELEDELNSLTCISCGWKYPVREGVPVFLKGEGEYWGEISSDEMAELLALGREKGWREAVYNRLMISHPFVYRYACDWRRGDFRFLLPPGGGAVALDLGAGFGMVSRCLSENYREVVAIDPVFERVAFLEMVREQEGLSNLTVLCGGDDLRYPFPDETFDLVVVSGVLEWVGDFYRKLPPDQVQEVLLRKVWGYLKEGGILYLGIENRYGFQYFLGVRDHNGMRFTSLMPRSLADVLSKRRKGDVYRVLTHSFRGYHRLLSNAGFDDVRIHWAFPDYREIRAIVPLYEPNLLTHFVDLLMPSDTPGQWLQRNMAALFNRLGLLPYTATTFSIVARKSSRGFPSGSLRKRVHRVREGGRSVEAGGSKRKSLIETIVMELAERSEAVSKAIENVGTGADGEGLSFIQLVCNPAAHGKAVFSVFLGGRPILLVKVSRRGTAKPFLSNEAKVLERLRSLFPGELTRSIPEVLALEEYGTALVLIEEYARGKPLSREDSSRRIEVGIRWLAAFYRATAKKVTVNGDVMEEKILGPLRDYESGFGGSTVVAKAVDQLVKAFKGRELYLTARHGDFWPGNVIMADRPVVIDWDFSSFDALPFFDYFYYLGYDLWLEWGGSFRDIFRIVPDQHGERIRSVMEGELSFLGYLPGELPLLYTVFCVEACLQQHRRLIEDSENGLLSFSPELEVEQEDYRRRMSEEFFRRLAEERLAAI